LTFYDYKYCADLINFCIGRLAAMNNNAWV